MGLGRNIHFISIPGLGSGPTGHWPENQFCMGRSRLGLFGETRADPTEVGERLSKKPEPGLPNLGQVAQPGMY